jgi:hypothetical protein
MKIKVPIRYMSLKNDKESKEKRHLKRLLGKEEEDEEGSMDDLIKYEYKMLVCDSTDVKTFIEYDDDHTTLGLFGGDFYIIKVKFPIFEAFYNFVNGVEIKDIDSFNFSKP